MGRDSGHGQGESEVYVPRYKASVSVCPLSIYLFSGPTEVSHVSGLVLPPPSLSSGRRGSRPPTPQWVRHRLNQDRGDLTVEVSHPRDKTSDDVGTTDLDPSHLWSCTNLKTSIPGKSTPSHLYHPRIIHGCTSSCLLFRYTGTSVSSLSTSVFGSHRTRPSPSFLGGALGGIRRSGSGVELQPQAGGLGTLLFKDHKIRGLKHR